MRDSWCVIRDVYAPIFALLLSFTFHAPRFTHHVSRFTFHVSRFTHHVSRITFHASRINTTIPPTSARETRASAGNAASIPKFV
ncbi:hypothetical protein QUF80_07345 [Desulfococcaceae bacterium HSG8]|nr:hypothetical protein [Desulfococcaceae bacterium HSG8]